MFCPNCGTKNDDSALKCSQCGFDQKPKGAAPKHKGTVMMTGSPAANSGAAKPKAMPNLKGTMVGVAPPDLSGVRPGGAKAATSASAMNAGAKSPKPNLKGTMVGVAPPGLEDLKKQAAATKKAAANPGGATGAAKQDPPPNLKGTMIGLAPPDVSARVEAAKAKLVEQKAKAAEERAAAAPSAAASKGPPSKLKGTMIGVAPPGMQAQIDAARGAAAAKKAAEGAATPSPAAPQGTDNEPPSEPDPLGGTVVGTSPFASGDSAGPADFSDDTPPAGNDALAATAAVSPVQNLPQSPDLSTPEAPAFEAPSAGDMQTAPEQSPPTVDRLPVTKSSTGPMLVVVLLLIVAAGIGFLVMGGGGEDEPLDAETAEEGEKATPTTNE